MARFCLDILNPLLIVIAPGFLRDKSNLIEAIYSSELAAVKPWPPPIEFNPGENVIMSEKRLSVSRVPPHRKSCSPSASFGLPNSSSMVDTIILKGLLRFCAHTNGDLESYCGLIIDLN